MATETNTPLVAVIMGSKSDWDTMKLASETLAKFDIPHECKIVSAHRTPLLLAEFAATAERLRGPIAQLLVEAPDDQVERFNTQYYAMTQGSLRNLVDLAHDLGVFKGVQNERKYGGEGQEEPADR